MTELMPDLSSNNPLPDLATLHASGVNWLGLKATEGTGYSWGSHQPLAAQAHALGMRVVHYHFAQPGYSGPAAQAAWFMAEVQPVLAAGDICCLDLEVVGGLSDAQLAGWAQQFIAAIPTPWLYASLYFVTSRAGLAAVTATVPWWIAAYQGSEPNPGVQFQLAAWQFADDHSFAGISRPVDASYVYYTSESPDGGGSELEDDMPTADEVAKAVWEYPSPVTGMSPAGGAPMYAQVIDARTLLGVLPRDVWDQVLTGRGGLPDATAQIYVVDGRVAGAQANDKLDAIAAVLAAIAARPPGAEDDSLAVEALNMVSAAFAELSADLKAKAV